MLNEDALRKKNAVEDRCFVEILKNSLPKTDFTDEKKSLIEDLLKTAPEEDHLFRKWQENLFPILLCDDPHLQTFIKEKITSCRPSNARLEVFSEQLFSFSKALENFPQINGILEKAKMSEGEKRGRRKGTIDKPTHIFINDIGKILENLAGHLPEYSKIQNLVSAIMEPDEHDTDKKTFLRSQIQQWIKTKQSPL